jgi:hypothetical protein
LKVKYGILEPNAEDCLVLSVFDQSPKGDEMRDYRIARGLDEISYFLGIPGISRDLVYNRIESLSREEIREYLDGIPSQGVQACLMLCDTGAGGGIRDVHAQSPRYEF